MGSYGLLQTDHSVTHPTPDVYTCTYCAFSRSKLWSEWEHDVA